MNFIESGLGKHENTTLRVKKLVKNGVNEENLNKFSEKFHEIESDCESFID